MGSIPSVKAQLDARRGDWPAICQATGLNYHWLVKFAQGRIAEPGATKLAKLAAHLRASDRKRDREAPRD